MPWRYCCWRRTRVGIRGVQPARVGFYQNGGNASLRACGTAAARAENALAGNKGGPTWPEGYTAALSLIRSLGA
jgi:hypothetical protein